MTERKHDPLENAVERGAARRMIDSAVAAERERCAKLVESCHQFHISYDGTPLVTPMDLAKTVLIWFASSIAEQIREPPSGHGESAGQKDD